MLRSEMDTNVAVNQRSNGRYAEFSGLESKKYKDLKISGGSTVGGYRKIDPPQENFEPRTLRTSDRGKSASTASLTAQALGGSKVGAGADMPIIAGPRPLSKALLPREQRQPSAAYQPVIGSSLTFLGSSPSASAASNTSQRRNSISTFTYPTRLSIPTTPATSETMGRIRASDSKEQRSTNLSLYQGQTSTKETLRVPDVTSYRTGSRSPGVVSSSSSRRPVVVEESIYPLLRKAFGKDDSEVEERELSRLRAATERKPSDQLSNGNTGRKSITEQSPQLKINRKAEDVFINEDISPAVIRSPRLIGLTKALANQQTGLLANRVQRMEENSISQVSDTLNNKQSAQNSSTSVSARPAVNSSSPTVLSRRANGRPNDHVTRFGRSLSSHETETVLSLARQSSVTDSEREDLSGHHTGSQYLKDTTSNPDSDFIRSSEQSRVSLSTSGTSGPSLLRSVERSGQNVSLGGENDWYQPIPETPRKIIVTPRLLTLTPGSTFSADSPYSNFFSRFEASEQNSKELPATERLLVHDSSESKETNNCPTAQSDKRDEAGNGGGDINSKVESYTCSRDFRPTSNITGHWSNDSHVPENNLKPFRSSFIVPYIPSDSHTDSSPNSHTDSSSNYHTDSSSNSHTDSSKSSSNRRSSVIGGSDDDVMINTWTEGNSEVTRSIVIQHRTSDSINTDDSGIDRTSEAGMGGCDGGGDILVDDQYQHYSPVDGYEAGGSPWSQPDTEVTECSHGSPDNERSLAIGKSDATDKVTTSQISLDATRQLNPTGRPTLGHVTTSSDGATETCSVGSSLTLVNKLLKDNQETYQSLKSRSLTSRDTNPIPRSANSICPSTEPFRRGYWTEVHAKEVGSRSGSSRGEKSSVTAGGCEKCESLVVEIEKGRVGLGFCIEGGKGSAAGDRPIAVKRIFKGQTAVEEVLRAGDIIETLSGTDFTQLSQYEAWNFMKLLPEGVVSLSIRRCLQTQTH